MTMISDGRIVLSAPLEAIKESHRVGGRVPSLDEIFVARVGKPRRQRRSPESAWCRRAIAWEFRRRHRWGLIALGAYLVVFLAIKLMILGPGHPIKMNPPNGLAGFVVVPVSRRSSISSRCSASDFPAIWQRASRCIPPGCSRCR